MKARNKAQKTRKLVAMRPFLLLLVASLLVHCMHAKAIKQTNNCKQTNHMVWPRTQKHDVKEVEWSLLLC
jgi:hypothetical protein